MGSRVTMQEITRKRVASSHDGRFSYWIDDDHYVYQRREMSGEWVGWFCSLPAWERTFNKCSWMEVTA